MHHYLLDIANINIKLCERKNSIGGNLLKSFQSSQNFCLVITRSYHSLNQEDISENVREDSREHY